MQKKRVIVRASGGEPLERIVMGRGRRVIYLANPHRISAELSGETDPVGFPVEDVFAFNDQVYEALCLQWQKTQATKNADWEALRPYHDEKGFDPATFQATAIPVSRG